MATTIKLTDNKGKEYTLSYNRASIRIMSKRGFSPERLESDPLAPFDLFTGAFLRNHNDAKPEEIESLWKAIPDKEAFCTVLGEMYSEPIQDLYDEPSGDAPKVMWEVVK